MDTKSATSLFEQTAHAMKEAGYYHISVEVDTGRLIAAYTPTEEAISQLKDGKYRSENLTTTGRFWDFDLVIDGWELESCTAWVIRQPEGAGSPANLFWKGRICSGFLAGTAREISTIGKLALSAHFY